METTPFDFDPSDPGYRRSGRYRARARADAVYAGRIMRNYLRGRGFCNRRQLLLNTCLNSAAVLDAAVAYLDDELEIRVVPMHVRGRFATWYRLRREVPPMTTEDDFQAALDTDPADWQTRLVFADWLQERGDPRAEGYRALGVLRKYPDGVDIEGGAGHWYFQYSVEWKDEIHAAPKVLPMDWYQRLADGLAQWWPSTRRAAEDIVVLGFARLPAERRAELLVTVIR